LKTAAEIAILQSRAQWRVRMRAVRSADQITLDQAHARVAAAHELVAAIEERQLVAVGLALLPAEEFDAILRKTKQIITQHALRDGLIDAVEFEGMV
jgi:hypothetical protein